jgi:hypothetical protein
MVQKGNGNSSPHLKNEIELATPKSERRELREAELLDVGRQESEMRLHWLFLKSQQKEDRSMIKSAFVAVNMRLSSCLEVCRSWVL